MNASNVAATIALVAFVIAPGFVSAQAPVPQPPPAAPSAPAPYGDLGALERTATELERIAARGGWSAVPDGATLREGDSGPRVEALRRRLAEMGDLRRTAASSRDSGSAAAPTAPGTGPSAAPGPATGVPGAGPQSAGAATYDEPLVEAVKRFQARRGLLVDGIVGPKTLAALATSPAELASRARQAADQMRAFAEKAPPRYVLVNVPDFRLFWVDDHRVADTMKVIVGKQGWRTPSMDETIEYLVVNPDWDVPASIVAADIAPKVAKDPGYLEKNHMVVLSGWGSDARRIAASEIDWSSVTRGNWKYHLRQRPGPDNPLGTLKFMFPNDSNIYLHGTPATHLFERDRRALSHGCIRVERPVELAREILQGQPEKLSKLDRALRDVRDQERVTLDEPVPVFIVYWPAFVENGEVQFRPDPWG